MEEGCYQRIFLMFFIEGFFNLTYHKRFLSFYFVGICLDITKLFASLSLLFPAYVVFQIYEC